MAKSTAAKTTKKAAKPATEKPVAPKAAPKAVAPKAPEIKVAAPKEVAPKASAAAKAAPTAKATSSTKTISAQDRYHMIDEAAYYRAEKNGFQVDPHANWIAAEQEIDELLAKQNIKVG